jgi:L-asparaginase II
MNDRSQAMPPDAAAAVPANDAATPANPVLVELWRGDAVESAHRGAAAVVDAAGALVASWGDVARPVYPRSAVKPLQALALLETGAAEACGVSDEEIALACASHSAEPAHVTLAAGWLARIGLGPQDLECGAHPPLGRHAAEALLAGGTAPLPLHNNCSGKHAAMLTTARHLGEPTKGYVSADHPVQRRIRDLLSEMTGADLAAAPVGTDGCSIPTYAAPLRNLARAMAWFAAPETLPPGRGAAARLIARALVAHPFMIAGSGRFDTLMISRSSGAALVKTGAEGVYMGAVPARQDRAALGIALKIDDGATRASEVAVAGLLRYLDVLDDAAWARLQTIAQPRLKNWRGTETGAIRLAPGWLDRG